MPAGVFQYLHLSHADTARLMGDPRVASVCFTGSVSGGRAVVAATAAGFATSGLELGGKDPAYVRADANLAHAIETLTDGAFFNAGQSCCGIKRIYVAASRYDEFVAGVVDLTQKVSAGITRSIRKRRSGRWCAPPPPRRSAPRCAMRSPAGRAS